MAESWVIALITTFGGIVSSLGALWVRHKLKKNDRIKVNRKTLKNHYLFTQIEYWIEYMIPQTNFGDIGRTKIVLTNTSNIFKKFIDTEFNNKSQEIFHTSMIQILFQIKSESDAVSSGLGIPEKFIDKFHNWNARTTVFVKGCVDNICRSNYYSSNKDRLYAIMNIMMSAYESTILDGENTLCALNGELDGLEYKGFTLQRNEKDSHKSTDIEWIPIIKYTPDGIITKLTHLGEKRLDITPVQMVGGLIFDYITKNSTSLLHELHNKIFNEKTTSQDNENIKNIEKISFNINGNNIVMDIIMRVDTISDEICMLSYFT